MAKMGIVNGEEKVSGYCSDCFNDYAIKEYIELEGSLGTCNYCQNTDSNVVGAEQLGHMVRECFHKAYEHVETAGTYWDPEERECTVDTTARDHLVGQLEAVDEDIVDDLISSSAPSWRAITQGDCDLLDGGEALYVFINAMFGTEENKFSDAWSYFKFHVTHSWRFFEQIDGASRGTILEPIIRHILKSEELVAVGTSFYRSRIARTELSIDPPENQKYIGPPPSKVSSHNRMSPAGIPYFYISGDCDTCISEIAPNVGDNVCVGEFVSKKELRVLDLTEVPSIRIPSIFDSEYDHNLNWGASFAKEFIRELSQPYTKKDNLVDYVPTQVLSEYIRSQGYEGLKFKSSQNPSGINYTFFCGPKDDDSNGNYYAGITSFTEWFHLKSIETKTVESIAIQCSSLDPGGSFTDSEVNPPPAPSQF